MAPTPTTFDLAEKAADRGAVAAALAGAAPACFWLDTAERPEPRPPVSADLDADLAVVGGGYTGLWTALMAKERNPRRRVVLLEGRRIGWAASGRNGGFCQSSLTHGEANGLKHLPRENQQLVRLGLENLREIREALERYRIDCDWEETGSLEVATEPHQVDWLRGMAEPGGAEFLGRNAVRAEVRSPTYLAGLWNRRGTAMVNPAKLAWGLARACADLGVRIHEGTPVRGLRREGAGVVLSTDGGEVRAAKAALGTNAFPSLLRRTRLFTVPVYDYALVTEPLTARQVESVGWWHRQGVSDLNNRFHYYRLTADNRILFGGYDALYHFGRSMRPEYEHSEATYRRLAAHFQATFPQLKGVLFTHAWGGAIDTCSRFFPFFMRAHGDPQAGYTGLGVAATRFGANVMLDLLDGARTERTSLEMVRRKPVPFPPEPLAWAGMRLTAAAMVRQDRNAGKRGPWLRCADALGMGFDS
ncbi:oxidoreductase [Zafaria cholistanensis]|uniref:Oxidoreductase n=1 Tax=Zafaria cholistanensis TaxID=1682741 RepID=A0A5A7NSC4_9MICC|nr:FAD-dependent oxidoreductase [Zafaria cholistanensis]GER23619.1 oxidoreductase [Zafaria cholistanensis]